MSTPTLIIERSNERGKFTEQELRTRVRESHVFWISAPGKKRKAQLDREARSRKAPPTAATAASREYWHRRAALLEKSAPQI